VGRAPRSRRRLSSAARAAPIGMPADHVATSDLLLASILSGVSQTPDLLISDADRSEAAAALRRHYESGRLTLEEFETRVSNAQTARTEADLDEVLRQLPVAGRPTFSPRDRRWSSLALQYLALNLVPVLIWLASGAHGDFWPKWVLLATLILTLRRIGLLPSRHRRARLAASARPTGFEVEPPAEDGSEPAS